MKVSIAVRGAVAAAAFWLSAGVPALAAPCTPDDDDTQLQVEVRGVRNARGQVVVTVYPDDARRFLAPRGKLKRVRAPASAPVTTVCVETPGPGVYAVVVYHDQNADRDFNRTRIGLPAEGYAFSNDAPTPVGLPAFGDVRFRVRGGIHRLPVRMRY